MHKNSVKYRVTSAEKILGRPLGDDRQAIELALTACHWLGRAVLATERRARRRSPQLGERRLGRVVAAHAVGARPGGVAAEHR